MARKRDEGAVDPGDASTKGAAPKDPPARFEQDVRGKRWLEKLGEQNKGAAAITLQEREDNR